MSQVCPNCNALVGDESQRCAACGELLDPFLTIQPPKFQGVAPSAAKVAARPREEPPARAERPEPAPQADLPAPPPRPKRKPRPVAPTPPPPMAAAPPAQPAPPPYAAQPVAPAAMGFGPPAAYPAPPPGQPPGKLRSMLIKMLGGNAESPPPEFQRPGPAFAPPQPGYPPNQGHPWAPPVGAEPWPQPPAPQGFAPQGFAPGMAPHATPGTAQPFAPSPSAPQATDSGSDDGMTRIMGGADLQKLKAPTNPLTLQILDRGGQWHPWAKIGAGGLKIGRSEKTNQFPELNSMATRHMRLSSEGGKLLVEDLGALNGVYLRINRPYPLEDGTRFRVGGQVIEFRAAEPPAPVEPIRAEDNEEFWSRDLAPLAYLEFIRPDNTAGPRYPITKRDPTILGRESRPGKPIDIALPNDEWVSGQHAQVRPDNGTFFLEDLTSRNGTFLRIGGTTIIQPGEVLLVGRVLFRVVHQA